MCDICREILGSCVRRHIEKDCALKKASYCTGCAIYGHTFRECVKVAHDVEYLEQLIPSCISIDSNTKINTCTSNSNVLEVSKHYVEKPLYIEDYISKHNLILYTITSKTPLKNNCEPKPYKATIDVLDNPKAIRDLLKAYGQMPKKDNRNKDKYKIYLEKFGKKNNYNIVYHESEKKDDSSVDD